MGPEREIQEALETAGDPAGAFLWRRVCRDLEGDLRVAVVARDEALAGRVIRRLGGVDRVEWIVLRLEGGDGEDLRPTLGALDRLLSVHALIWATPATAALGAEERAGMDALADAGAPGRRVLVVADLDLLERMSDQPEAEAAEVHERVRALLPAGWTTRPEPEARAWVETARADRLALTRDRRRSVAAVLLREARRRADVAIAQATDELARVSELVRAEAQALDEARRRGRRTAAHLLGAMRRQTERLLVDLRDFLLRLEQDLPAQVEAVDDLDRVRRTLPHWLHHVVESWMSQRLSEWRAEVLVDLSEVGLAEDDLDRAELLVPALHPAPVRAEAGWGQRLGVTATLGSGAAMLVFGLWIPGLLALTGGLAWSVLGRRAAEAGNRRALIDAAVDTVRQMGQDAERLLREQIQTLEDELDRLGEERAAEVERSRAGPRDTLLGEQTARQKRLDDLLAVLAELQRRIAALPPEEV